MSDSKEGAGMESGFEIHLLSSTISEEEKDLASKAAKDFEAAKFKDSSSSLSRLSQLRPNDSKVKQNKTVADYYGTGLKFTETYLSSLNAIGENIDEPEALEDLDHCVHYYNKTLLHYHMCQFQTALDIGEKLLQFILPMEDNLTRKFAFLMVELYLRTFQPEKALNLLAVAEKLILGGGSGAGSGGNNGSKSGGGAAQQEKSEKPDVDEDTWKARLSLYKARGFIMLHSMKPCKREMKVLMTSCPNAQAAVYLKAYFAYSAHNPRKALKVLNTALTTGVIGSGGVSTSEGRAPLPKAISCGESLSSMYFTALGCVHHGMEKHALAAHYFRKALDEDRKAVNEVRKNMAASAKGASPPTSFDGIPVYCLGLSHRHEILYNLGVQLLQSGNPSGAFDCLVEVVQVFHLNPRLWLRLAEACVMASRTSNEAACEISEKLKVVEGCVGSGLHRKVVFGRGLFVNYYHGSASDLKTSAIPNATLEFAALCLRNALLLLPLDEPAQSTPTSSSAASGDESQKAPDSNAVPYRTEGPHFCPVAPSNPIRSQSEIQSLRCSILAASAYVALVLDDSVMALRHAKALLAQPKLSGAHKFLGRLYMSEAQLNLDNISDAVQLLNPDLVDDVTVANTDGAVARSSNASSPASNSPSGANADAEDGVEARKDSSGSNRNWWPNDVGTAKGVVHLNLAVAHMIRGEGDKARHNLDKADELFGPNSPAPLMQAWFYLNLLEGDRAGVQSLLKTNYGHVTGNANTPNAYLGGSQVKWG